MTVTAKKDIHCYYNTLVKQWIDDLRYGTSCVDLTLLKQIELDLFMWDESISCNIKYCFNYGQSEQDCSTTLDCNMTLVNTETPDTNCSFMSLISFNNDKY